MIVPFILFTALFQVAAGPHASLVAKSSDPPGRNFYLISQDDVFVFAARHYGNADDAGGNTEPGLFVQVKQTGRWIQVTAISTEGGRFGSSSSDDPEAQKKLMSSQVSWNFHGMKSLPYVGQPMMTSGSIVFPDKITYDARKDLYELRYMTSWGVPSAETVLYIKRADLLAAFPRAKAG